MNLKVNFKARDIVVTNGDISEQILHKAVGYVSPRYLTINRYKSSSASIEIRAPDMSPLLRCTLSYTLAPDRRTFSSDITLTASEYLSHWILAKITSSTSKDESPDLTHLKKRYILAAKNLQGLKHKLRLSRICTAVFFFYSAISIIATAATFITHNVHAKKYGQPLFTSLSIAFIAVFVAFLISIPCFKEEIGGAKAEYNSVLKSLLTEIKLSKELLVEKCNQYIASTKELNIPLIRLQETQIDGVANEEERLSLR
ncbi:hypothetical protein NHE_0747 [Neorickettsia helminthoeca str. Oregon]|uniref:Uncharacterized protein n=1 Tax=Neorickettsia helminthoeca str. Oregon TaxID=1286528 RepID=X5HKT5_9RICK|nr:hypothetical protein [Neorickettsia helminthoeca]AHX11679.1 hypothetical protein NHE_0747 [Neorickettsia helminthoeca str. Oregon]